MNLSLNLSAALSFSAPNGMTAAEWGAAQAETLASFISGLSEKGYTLASVTTAQPAAPRSNAPQNGKGKFEMAYLEWKGQQRMHHKGNDDETREQYARRMLMEGGMVSLVDTLDNAPESSVGEGPTDAAPPAYDPTPGEADDSALE